MIKKNQDKELSVEGDLSLWKEKRLEENVFYVLISPGGDVMSKFSLFHFLCFCCNSWASIRETRVILNVYKQQSIENFGCN